MEGSEYIVSERIKLRSYVIFAGKELLSAASPEESSGDAYCIIFKCA
jgi:hypothetical protein